MRYSILPSLAKGCVEGQKSKSIAHRVLLLCAFTGGVCRISGVPECEDVEATLRCLDALGVRYERDGGHLTVDARERTQKRAPHTMHIGESASTLRFFIPLALALKTEMTFVGKARVFQRPLGEYEKLFRRMGCPFLLGAEGLYVDGRECGRLPEETEVDATVSSQFITGLAFMYALGGGGRIRLKGEVVSRPYIDLTISALRTFGCEAHFLSDDCLAIEGGQRLTPCEVEIEGDYSASAFLDALNLFGGEVKVMGLVKNSLQGDRVYRDFFPLLRDGAPVLNLQACPDLAPVLMALASHFHGATLTSCARLKHKESDRGMQMAKELSKLGADIEISGDTIVIHKTKLHPPTEALFSHGDHRIAMALSVLLTVYGGELEGAECVAKSFPDFFQTLKKLGIGIVACQ